MRAHRARPFSGGLRSTILSVAFLLMIACGQGVDPAPETQSRSTSLLPEERVALPEFGFDQFQALLQELRGTSVVINIWGSWCPPCQVEAPDLAKVAREFEGRVQFVGVDILDSREPARNFILAFDWPYPSVFDPNGEIRDRLGYVGQPITVVYDARGDVAFEWAGVITADLLRTEIREVLTV